MQNEQNAGEQNADEPDEHICAEPDANMDEQVSDEPKTSDELDQVQPVHGCCCIL